jgi:saccharopine dehydrogenase-like NADP-dependent oxidoreductase
MKQAVILVLGAGNIGTIIAQLLSASEHYHVHLVDIDPANALQKVLDSKEKPPHIAALDISQDKALVHYIKTHHVDAVISALPHQFVAQAANAVASCGIHYFDLTEDVESTRMIEQIAQGKQSMFMPQCGLAPGFINILAAHLMHDFEQIDTVKLRCGALPQEPTGALNYALTWSTDGLINEYGNPSFGIEDGEKVQFNPLNNIEQLNVANIDFEAFNTSGGIGTLIDTCPDHVKSLNYKTIRFPGHRDKMKFLMQDLKLNDDRATLKHILETALPRTEDDMVVVDVSVDGRKDEQTKRAHYANIFYPADLFGITCTAIQASTASGVCAAVDMMLNQDTPQHGFVHQKAIAYPSLIKNRFGHYFATSC